MAFKSLTRRSIIKKISFLPAVLAAAMLFTAPASADPLSIVGFGDSLMAGYGLAPGESFPEKLEAALKTENPQISVANAGVSGDTTSGARARLEWSVPEDADVVIVELGANDMLRGLPPAETEANLDAIIEKLKARGQTVILAGMLAAPNMGEDFAENFNAIYPRLAEKHDLTLIPFFLDGVAAEPSLLLDDGMHPNAQGVERMVERILPMVQSVLAQQTQEDA